MDEVLDVCWPTTARCAVLPGVRGCGRPHEPNAVQRHGRMQCSSVDEALFPRPLEGGGDVRPELMDLRTMIDSQSCGHCSYRFGRKKIMMLNRTFGGSCRVEYSETGSTTSHSSSTP
ncbi:hypothetical protein PHYPSEUDO_006623 [Phytophthora pseudosyringae]|uniref:Uncharacterized protein n=1 Tax=Phytophthora pseudosyringae TaxID=221518 RepID=A0A8T1WC26_9STRA|nr:hypothetical protein PHYPSEUDO_006623 [Phytophthora pseudosyringae]